MYQFSAPMPCNIEHVDKIVEMNSKYKKSKITSLYFAFTPVCDLYTGFEQVRTYIKAKLVQKDWLNIAKYCMEKGFKLIYLLNATKSCELGQDIREAQFERVDELVNELSKYGCNIFRVCDFELINYMIEHHPNKTLYASTSYEYQNMKQYQNFVNTYPQIKQFVPALDTNRNFKLLKNLKKNFPNIEIELITNEACMFGCPFRFNHHASIPSGFLEEETINCIKDITKEKVFCRKAFGLDFINQVFKTNIIHPWDLNEYKKIGITNFKLVGRNTPDYETGELYDDFEIYLKGVENDKDIENYQYKRLGVYIKGASNFNYTIKEIRPFLPKINQFIKKGYLCSSECGSECNYCVECANKFKKKFNVN